MSSGKTGRAAAPWACLAFFSPRPCLPLFSHTYSLFLSLNHAFSPYIAGSRRAANNGWNDISSDGQADAVQPVPLALVLCPACLPALTFLRPPNLLFSLALCRAGILPVWQLPGSALGVPLSPPSASTACSFSQEEGWPCGILSPPATLCETFLLDMWDGH